MKTKQIQKYYSLSILPLLLVALAGANAQEPPKAKDGSSKAPEHPASDKMLSFADFEKAKAVTSAEVPWELFTDSSMGGKSTIQISVISDGSQGSKGALRLTAKLAPDFQWGGFAGVRAWLRPDGAPKDMGAASGVQFYARGEGKKYRLLVAKENVKEGNHFAAEFTATTEWTLIQVPFSKLAQSPYFGTPVQWSPTNITGLGFLTSAEPGATTEVRLDIDNIIFCAGR